MGIKLAWTLEWPEWCYPNRASEASRRKWALHGEGWEGEEEGHVFWRVGVFLSFPATVINVVSTSLQLNALQRKPGASCCLTSTAKLEIKKKRGKRRKKANLPCPDQGCQPPKWHQLLFPGGVVGKAHARCRLLFKSIRIQKIISKKDIFKTQQNRQQSRRS